MDTNEIDNLLQEAQQDTSALNKAFDDIVVRMIIMTPKLAKTLITKHEQNYKPYNAPITNYPVIAITNKGYILDGYNHLETVIQTNNKIPFVVITGITYDEK